MRLHLSAVAAAAALLPLLLLLDLAAKSSAFSVVPPPSHAASSTARRVSATTPTPLLFVVGRQSSRQLLLSSLASTKEEATTATGGIADETVDDDNKNANDDDEQEEAAHPSPAPPASSSSSSSLSLPELFPELSSAISSLGFVAPTPIQAASAERALSGDNLLLIAPTGSGKTLAYLLPAVTKAMAEDGTILIVAPTRELAVQLTRNAVELLSGVTDDAESCVRLAVRGVEMPTPSELEGATILIGTPPELLYTLTSVDGGTGFVAGDTLSAVILDEVDVLIPPAPKQMRTALDSRDGGKKRTTNNARDERTKKEQKRKLMAAKRRGVQMDDSGNSKRVVSDTEKILNLAASGRMAGQDGETNPAQVLAGSATASRKALERLNWALRSSANEASIPFELAWTKSVAACRPAAVVVGSSEASSSGAVSGEEAASSGAVVGEGGEQHTIRAVTVPPEVRHRYIELSKEAASTPSHVLSAVAKAAAALTPETSLVFLCGEFGKPTTKQKARAPPPEVRGATSKSRRNAKRKQKENAARALFKQKRVAGGKQKDSSSSGAGGDGTGGFSARKVCAALGELGLDAQPLHVALGLELNANKDENDDEDEPEPPPFLVTFEGSARGLHFDAVDAVFVVGRPASAASYLHLAGRVGRAFADEDGNVVVRPGTVVSVCTKGSATELHKWTKQIGGTELEELVL